MNAGKNFIVARTVKTVQWLSFLSGVTWIPVAEILFYRTW